MSDGKRTVIPGPIVLFQDEQHRVTRSAVTVLERADRDGFTCTCRVRVEEARPDALDAVAWFRLQDIDVQGGRAGQRAAGWHTSDAAGHSVPLAIALLAGHPDTRDVMAGFYK
jgi:hypothetical protein